MKLIYLFIPWLLACNYVKEPTDQPAPIKSSAPVKTVDAPAPQPAPVIPVLSSYSTKLKNDKERTENIKRAAGSINGYIIKPKESFSFNEVVGPRTKERGFHEAPQYFAQAKVDGVGGGVCQVSSTLYVAAMRGMFTIARRYSHSRPVSYTPPGTDAAVVDGGQDLVLENPYPENITILADVKDEQLTVTLIGHKLEWEVDYIIKNGLVSTEPPVQQITSPYITKPKMVQEGKPGFSRTVVWSYRQGDEVIKQVVYSKYKPVPELWVVPKEDEHVQ